MKERVINYSVKGDGEFLQGFSSLRAAREYVKDLPVHVGIENVPSKVQVLKVVTITTLLNEYEPQTVVVLKSTSAFDEIELA